MSVPSPGRIVHYVPHGTPPRPDGGQAYPTGACRPAIITEVLGDTAPAEAAALGAGPLSVELAVINPTGIFFRPLSEGGVPSAETDHEPGSWHWPERAP